MYLRDLPLLKSEVLILGSLAEGNELVLVLQERPASGEPIWDGRLWKFDIVDYVHRAQDHSLFRCLALQNPLEEAAGHQVDALFPLHKFDRHI